MGHYKENIQTKVTVVDGKSHKCITHQTQSYFYLEGNNSAKEERLINSSAILQRQSNDDNRTQLGDNRIFSIFLSQQ